MNFSAVSHNSTLWPNSTGFCRRPRLINSVCGSKRLNTRSLAGTVSPSTLRPPGGGRDRLHRRQIGLQFQRHGRQLQVARRAVLPRRNPRRSPRSTPPARSACGSAAFTCRCRDFDLLGMYRVMYRYSRLILRLWKRCGTLSGANLPRPLQQPRRHPPGVPQQRRSRSGSGCSTPPPSCRCGSPSG